MRSKTHQKRTKKRIMNLQQKRRGGYNPNQKSYLSTGIDSSRLDTPQIKVLVCMGTLGSLPMSSRLEITVAALLESDSFSFESVFLILSAERLIFLGTEISLIIRSSTSMHCLTTSLGFSDTVITTGCYYKTRTSY